MAPGQKLMLGDAAFTVAKVITAEPDRGSGFAGFAPRVMLRESDLVVMGLVQPASRITWRLAVAGDGAAGDEAVAAFTQWAEAQLKGADKAASATPAAPDTPDAPDTRGMSLESLDNEHPEMQTTLARAEKFLNLVALLEVFE